MHVKVDHGQINFDEFKSVICRGRIRILQIQEQDFEGAYKDHTHRYFRLLSVMSNVIELLRSSQSASILEFRGRITRDTRYILQAAFPSQKMKYTQTSPYWGHVSSITSLPAAIQMHPPLEDLALWIDPFFKLDASSSVAALSRGLPLQGVRTFTLRVPLHLLLHILRYPRPVAPIRFHIEIDMWDQSLNLEQMNTVLPPARGVLVEMAQRIYEQLLHYPLILPCIIRGVRSRINAPVEVLDRVERQAIEVATVLCTEVQNFFTRGQAFPFLT